MSCDPLPVTGPGTDLGLLLLSAVVLLAVGVVVLGAVRARRRGAGTAMLVLLLVGASVAVLPASAAQAATSDCVTSEGSLTVIQTSRMAGLAPTVAPVAITGLVRNNGPDSTVVAAVDVAITAITTAPGRTGTCDASDYVLLGTRMPVNQTLEPGGTAPFVGAAIGFRDKAINQDACQHATIHLRYTVVPGSPS